MDRLGPEEWCALSLAERRSLLAGLISERLRHHEGVTSVTLEVGPIGREYDLTIVVDTDVGRLRTPLWSHARQVIFCDGSIHPANREQLSPYLAVDEAVQRLEGRLAVPYSLESRGLSFSRAIEKGVTRTWTAEHSRFRKRTAVTREDVVEKADELDVRDLLRHFYTGESMRLVSPDGEPFLLAESVEIEGELITICRACSHWSNGSQGLCSNCGSGVVETVVAARPPRR